MTEAEKAITAVTEFVERIGNEQRTEAEKAITEFAERLQTYYKHLNGMTASGMVVYHIEQVKKEFLEKANEK